MQPARERPLGVTLIAVLLLLNGIASIIAAVGVLGPVPQGLVDAALAVAFGAALLYLAYGMWTLRGWAWLATLVVEGLNAIFAAVAIALSPGAIANWVSLILAVIIIVYLLQPSVKAAFTRPPASL